MQELKRKKKKIVHITSSLMRGGAENVLYQVIRGIDDELEQTVLYFHDGPYRAYIEKCGVPCIKVTGVVHRYDLYVLYRMYHILYDHKPDVIHTLLWLGTLWGRLAGKLLNVPVVSMYHGNVDQNGLIRNICDKYTFCLSRVNGAVSAGVAESIACELSKKVDTVIHNGIELKDVPKKVPHDLFVIGSVGRFVVIKKFDVLIKAVALLKKKQVPFLLKLIGVGPELFNLQRVVKEHDLNDNVEFLVDVVATDYYHLFDCFVLPSDREGISMALLEALRARVPAIVVNNQQHPVIQHGVNGLVVPAPEAQLIAAAIKEIQCDSMRAHQLADAGYATVLHSFNRDRMIAAYKKIFHSAMSTQ